MSKRMKIKLRNLRIYLRKYVINSKYIVRNTLAMVVMATFIVCVYGAGTLLSSLRQTKLSDKEQSVVADTYAESNTEAVITIETAEAPMMYTDSCGILSGELETQMGVEANELQLVAGVADTETETETTTESAVLTASITKQDTTQAPTTQAQTPATQAPTTQAQTPTTQAPTTQAPTTEVAAATDSTDVGVANRGAISLSEEDIRLMASVMTLECGGECYEGQLAVANVILTRYLSGYYGSTISDVVYSPYQFSVVATTAWENALANPQASCIQAAREAASGVNNIGSYIYFRPTWNATPESYSSYTVIGNHVFF